MKRQSTIDAILTHKIIVILRGVGGEKLCDTVRALYRGGIRLVELPFDQSGKTAKSDTARAIAMLVREFGESMEIGAGTVMTEEDVRLAKEAGAKYIVSPDSSKEIIELTVQSEIVSIPGAFTPTEAANATRWGADFVKLFPNSEVSISYLKAISLPLSHVRFLAVGGVNHENIKDYLKAGAVGAGVASSIVPKALLADGRYREIEELARLHVAAAMEDN